MSDQKSIKSVATEAAPAAIGPYSQGVAAGDLLFVSGQLPIDPESGELVTGSIGDMTHQIFKNIQAVAQAAGADLSRVVKTTVFLKDMNDFAEMNEVYAQYFDTPLPARSAVQVAALPKGADVEIESIIYIG